jgi:signal peptidase I
MEDQKIRLRKRKPLFALALSLFLAGLGHLYNGKPRKALIIFLIYSIIPFLFFQLSVLGSGQMLILFLLLSLLTSLGIYIWAAVDAWKQAKRIGEHYILRFYNKLYIYVLFIILLSFYPLGRIVDLSKVCFFAKPYRIITGSMAPTLLSGDLIMTDGRIDRSAPNYGLKKGELVVFKYPKDKTKHFVKRIIGLSGDKIEIKGMDIFVNGKKIPSREGPNLGNKLDEKSIKGTITLYEEGDSGTYAVIYRKGSERKDLSITVPEGCCFVIGDNRDNSLDSRHWGPIPLDDVVARVKAVYFSFDPEGGIRWGRIGKLLR